jgi:DNA polymerase-3 subunit gamma/tau
VYILDEVHMLSRAAEAALLKTLEEPPPHVVFVLATTDPQKMSDTIRSRTQHLQFHLLPADTLAEHVRWVAADAGLDVSEAALEQALSRGGGSARDTLSALELVASTGEEGMDLVPLDEYVDAMIDRDSGRALTVVAHAIASGMDPRTLTEELIAFLRNGFLALMAPELVQVPSNRLDALASQAQRLGAAGLVRGIELLGAGLAEMRHAPDPRVLLDVATVQLTADNVSGDTAALVQRIERLERQVAAGAAAPAVEKAPVPRDPATGRAALGGRARAGSESSGAPKTEPTAVVDPAPGDTGEPAVEPERSPAPADVVAPAVSSVAAAIATMITADVWENTIRPALRGMARAVYAPAEFVRSTESTLTLSVPNAVHRAKCEEQRPIVESALAAFAGVPVTVEFADDVDGGHRSGVASASRPAADTSATISSTSGADQADTRVRDERSDPGPSARERGLAAAAAGIDADGSLPGQFSDSSTELPDDDDVDLDDLVDAPPESVKSPIDRLAEAFPGSELIEEAG